MQPLLLIATNNRGKLSEYLVLLKGIPFKLVSPLDIGIKSSVQEEGKSFEENARLKAEILAQESNLLTLADDSGLEVEALGGEPGIMSARYAGENVTDAERINYLLGKLVEVPEEKRGARFRCVIAIVQPGGNTKIYTGECSGFITTEPRGVSGFGYDPVFFFPGLGKTMAELPPGVKNKVSHRGHAVKKARRVLFKIARESGK